MASNKWPPINCPQLSEHSQHYHNLFYLKIILMLSLHLFLVLRSGFTDVFAAVIVHIAVFCPSCNLARMETEAAGCDELLV